MKKLTDKNSLTRMAVAAMREAVAEVVKDHQRRGMPLAVWEKGKVVFIQPDKLASTVRESRSKYRGQTRKKA